MKKSTKSYPVLKLENIQYPSVINLSPSQNLKKSCSDNYYSEVYQIGEDQARSWIVAGTTAGGATPKVLAS